MTVLRCTCLDGSREVLDGRPQSENLLARGAFKGLKIPVSVVRFRPWAPKPCEILEGAWPQWSVQYRRPCIAGPRGQHGSAYRRHALWPACDRPTRRRFVPSSLDCRQRTPPTLHTPDAAWVPRPTELLGLEAVGSGHRRHLDTARGTKGSTTHGKRWTTPYSCGTTSLKGSSQRLKTRVNLA